MKTRLTSLLAAIFAACALLPQFAAADASYSSEAKPASKPRSVILGSYFEDGIVTKAPATKKVVAKKKAVVKKPVVKKAVAKKPVVKKAVVKKAAAKTPAKTAKK